MELLTPDEMRQAEEAAFAAGAATSRELMERAGHGAVAAIFDEWPELAEAPGRATLLCGPGNNGGDGYVVARLLHDRGWSVAVFALGDPGQSAPDAAENRRLWAERGPIAPLAQAESAAPADVIVDALFGIGLARPISADIARNLDRVGRAAGSARIVAIDCPSGLDCATGAIQTPDDGPATPLDADLTVTFHRPKLGHYLDQGPAVCGRLRVVDLGLTQGALGPASARLAAAADGGPPSGLRAAIRPGRRHHKYDRGHALILSGGVGRGGAARLAARAALRVGAGLVTVACPPAALIENAARLDAVMLRPARDAEDLAEILRDRRITAICAGPGLGVGARTRSMISATLAPASDAGRGAARRRVTLDADALTSFADDPDALFNQLHAGCLLTPHEGEFARLFPDLSVRERQARRLSKPDAARAAADRAGCAILLKGPDTVIASPGAHATIHAAAYGREAPWLGTAGAGDVLAGLATGLMARAAHGEGPHESAVHAAWLHVEAARAFGPGLIAEDLPETLPSVLRALDL